jgi:hypothetical protein
MVEARRMRYEQTMVKLAFVNYVHLFCLVHES